MVRENALFLENTCRRTLNYEDRGALNGLVDADQLNRVGTGYYVLAAALAPYFKEGNSRDRELINNFLDEFYSLSDSELTYGDYNELLGRAHGNLRELLNTLTA
ncbi:hypothetical protein SLU01_13070 [Sporosarcina luteola]|uniref:Uncharacterized protein n=1 Tax=Sporosarcina luteola TaxID=582850 RepID=A0A511Z6C3_9BACL|nr:hypothetical protein [Sporosarcina luteola]GEN82995.1 hypothetical protein SLU01_13070 [Sporosarcina luteola]